MKRVFATAGGVALAFVLALLAIRLAGYYVVIEPRLGRPTEAVLSFADAAPEPPLTQDFAPGERPRNLVLLIGDGMGFSHLMAARAALAGVNGRLEIERLPITGWLTTYSSQFIYTDSAAAATALASGVKTEPRVLSLDAAGRPAGTLFEAARAAGKAAGLVTDSYLWDATPAAFVVHLPSRDDLDRVAAAMAASEIELLAGERVPGNGDGGDAEGGALLAAFTRHDYRVARDYERLLETPKDARVLALLESGSVADPERSPSLEDLTRHALERLSRDGDGFVLMVETEETDTGSHLGDFERMVRGVRSLDSAARAALDFARRDRQTLVVVTADHETGGLTLLAGGEGRPLTVRWATRGHSAGPVPLLAYGPGAERLAGVRDNTELPRRLAELLAIELGATGAPADPAPVDVSGQGAAGE